MADFDKDGVIKLDDFRKILTYKPGEGDDQAVEGAEAIEDGDMEGEEDD